MARLIGTKLQPPPLRKERVYRRRLYESLADRTGCLVLVSAPPGFGKSTLVVEWLREQDRPFAWYSLDRFDRDAGLFCEYLGAAVGGLIGRDSGLLTFPGGPTPTARTMISTLIDDLAEAPEGCVIVLDDYHEIDDGDVHQAVAYLIENLPRHVALVISTRADPPLPLARLRAHGDVVDIRGDDLRFTVDEVAGYFWQSRAIELSDTEAETLAARSEGWVAALQLASVGAGWDDVTSLTDALSADHPHIAGYLVEEVLGRLEPELAGFLLDTATFERFDAELCRAVVDAADPIACIAELERRNAFLIPLGDTEHGWYRYHHLFAELLRSRLRRIDPERHRALLIAAAHACQRRHLPDDAIEYALQADDLGLAGQIIDASAESALGAGEVARLRSWLNRFPARTGPATAVVRLGWAWCRIFEDNLEAATQLIDRVEADHLDDFTIDIRGQLEIMRAMIAFQQADPVAAEDHAKRGVALLPPDSAYIECLGHLYIGRALYARSKREEARPHLERSASLSDRGNLFAAVTALFWLGGIDGDIGHLEAAERSMRRAQELSAATGGNGSAEPASGIADIGLAYMRLNQLDPEDAIRLAERGSRLVERSTFVEMMFRAQFVWAEALSLAGRYEESDTVANDAVAWLHGRSMGGGPLEAWLWMSQSRNQHRQGRLDEAGEILDRVVRRGLGGSNDAETFGFFEAAAVLSLTLRRGDVEESQRLFAELPPGLDGYVMFEIERHVLKAAVYELSGDKPNAAAALEPAFELAREGYRYQFSHVGPVILPVLKRVVGRTPYDDLARSIIDRMPIEIHRHTAPLVEPLTERELDVLAEIAAGYTNEEIADRLYISHGTVKRHTANIYLKLGAHHRAEAAAKGRELGLVG